MREDLDYTEIRWGSAYNTGIEFLAFSDNQPCDDLKIAEISYNAQGEGHITFSKICPIALNARLTIRMRIKDVDGIPREKWLYNVRVLNPLVEGELLKITCSPLDPIWN